MKKNLIIATIIFSLTIMSSNSSSAQGIFSSDSETEASSESSGRDGIFRSKGEGGVEPGTDPSQPVGSGLLILSALAGGYALVRNRKSKTLRKAH